MSYQPPRHFAVQNKSTLVSDRDVAYWTEACRMQLRDHVCPAWGIDTPPGAAVYPADTAFPADTALVAVFVDDIGDPGTLGEHGIVGDTPFVLVDAHLSAQPSAVLSHEFIETTVNVNLDRWTTPIQRGGRSYRYPFEPCDLVESSTYKVTAPGLDGMRAVDVSNFVLPAWFDQGSAGGWDFKGELTEPLQIAPGGYAAPEVDGRLTFIGQGELHLAARKFMPWGRASRLMRKGAPR
jgi:hypothetical protein